MDIIFHIGFPKCASTTLQNLVFKNEAGYLGTHRTLSKENNYAKQFQGISPVGPRLYGNLAQAKKWADKVMGSDKFSEGKNFIVSSELLTNSNKLKNRPIIDFLKRFQNEVWKDGKLKVLLILRNPAERMASEYAQISITNPYASQKDFEKHVSRRLRNHNHMKYDKWVVELYEAFGKENVCVLLMEEINELSFWSDLKDFCQLKNLEPERMLKNASSQNTRKKDKNSWHLQLYSPFERAKVMSNNIFGLLWPPYIASRFRSNANNTFRSLLEYCYRINTVINKDRGFIQLTPQLKEKINRQYFTQTENLTKLIKKDLKSIGY